MLFGQSLRLYTHKIYLHSFNCIRVTLNAQPKCRRNRRFFSSKCERLNKKPSSSHDGDDEIKKKGERKKQYIISKPFRYFGFDVAFGMCGRLSANPQHRARGHHTTEILDFVMCSAQTFRRLLWILSDGYKLKIVHTRKLLKMQINEWHTGNWVSWASWTGEERKKNQRANKTHK